MTGAPEERIREVLGGRQAGSSSALSREALAALEALVTQRDELARRLADAEEELARLRPVARAAGRILEEWGARRSATPMLAAMAELRAALRAAEPGEG